MDKWDGKVAIVTGASVGIGKEIALKLASHGVIVAAIARRLDKLQELSDSFKGKGKIVPFKMDVTLIENIREGYQTIENTLGPVHILVNNAGIMSRTAVLDFDIEKWRQMYDLNVMAMFSFCKVFMEAAEKDQDTLRHIVNINSILGYIQPMLSEIAVYSCTKHCVTTLTHQLRKDIAAKKINTRVTGINPGAVETELFSTGGWGDTFSGIKKLEVQDVSAAVIYSLSVRSGCTVSQLSIQSAEEMF